jgi:hypothetical protein
MPVRKIQHTESIDSVWQDLVYFHSRASAEPQAKDLAQLAEVLLTRGRQIREAQHDCWHAELVAQASVDRADDALDDLVAEVDEALYAICRRDRTLPRYRRYFPSAPSDLIRMGLERELPRVAPWAESLKSEPEAELAELGQRLDKMLIEGQSAVKQRAAAIAATADQRVRGIIPFIDDVNQALLSAYGMLVQRAAERNLPRDWAGRFFRHRVRREAPAAPAATEPTST